MVLANVAWLFRAVYPRIVVLKPRVRIPHFGDRHPSGIALIVSFTGLVIAGREVQAFASNSGAERASGRAHAVASHL